MNKMLIFLCLVSTLTLVQSQLGFLNGLNLLPNIESLPSVKPVSVVDQTPAPILEEGTDVSSRFGGDETNEGETVESYPCAGQVVQVTRPAGKITPATNYWDAHVDLSEFVYLRTIKLVIKVDNPAKIEYDELAATVSGPKSGKTFRITFNGSPKDVPEIRFRIIGTSGSQFPNIVSLHLNNRDICKAAVPILDNVAHFLTDTGADAAEQIVGGIGSIFGTGGGLFGVMPNAGNKGQGGGSKKPVTTTTTRRPTTKPQPKGCGKRQITQSAYITNGWEVRPGDFPWHAALYHRTSRSSSYKCGGTLINKQTVITAAHCLFVNGREIVPEKVSVQLGKHNLNILDSNTVEYQVLRIIVHPEYSSVDLQDDIALLRLDNVVEYTQHVFPACLWDPAKKSLENVIGKKGTVVGWGLTEEDQLAEVLNAGTMPVVSFLDCLESDRDFFGPFLSDYNYCAGYRNGTSVCNGDSGGGMFFKEGDAWTLRGLVSFSSVREDRDVCNPQNYVIFTDVAKYRDWIDKNL